MVLHVHRIFSFHQKISPYKVRHTDFCNILWTSQWLQNFQETQGRYNFAKHVKPKRAFLRSKQDQKFSLGTTVEFFIVTLHHTYSIQNNKEDTNKISKLFYMSQLQTCNFPYTDLWIARNNNFSCKKSFMMCGMKLVASQQFHSHLVTMHATFKYYPWTSHISENYKTT